MSSLRVAIVSTPRSGNTWVRNVLADTLGLEHIAVHNPLDIPPSLPPRVALQIHWYREPNFQAFLQSNDFKIVVLARHPLDVLVSALHFVRYEPLTARWLEGNAGLPDGLAGVDPTSREFLKYATGWAAENLLSVSYQWWHDPGVTQVHYERLVREPEKSFAALVEPLGGRPEALRLALQSNPFQKLRDTPGRHGWQGMPNLWRKLVVPLDAWAIERRHKRVFRTLGYKVSPYLLSRKTAFENWQALKV